MMLLCSPIPTQLRKMVVGDPRDAATEIGPLSRPGQLEFLQQQIEDAVGKGAKLLYGGRRVGGRGYLSSRRCWWMWIIG